MSDCRHNPGREFETGDVHTKGNQLDERTSEETIYKLVDFLYSGDGEVNVSAIDQYLEELDQVDSAHEEFDIEEGLKQFNDRFDASFDHHVEEVKPSRKRRPLTRIAIIAAAMCIFVITAQASGWDILGSIARWSSEQFSYVISGKPKDKTPVRKEYMSLQDALDAHSVMSPLSPTRFPNGTKLSKVLLKNGEDYQSFSASYELHGENFYISIRKVFDLPPTEVEIENQNVEIYEVEDVKHYIMSDVKQRKVSWRNGNWQCQISGNLSRDDLLAMIESIYE